jgi:hypothetical protein
MATSPVFTLSEVQNANTHVEIEKEQGEGTAKNANTKKVEGAETKQNRGNARK